MARPTLHDVAKRFVILEHVFIYAITTPPRSLIGETMRSWSSSQQRSFESEMREQGVKHWERIKARGLWDSMSPWERAFAQTAPLAMTEMQQIVASWRLESIQVLAWALGKAPSIPPYDTMVDHEEARVLFEYEVPAICGNHALRPEDAIDRARSSAELWHWRARTWELEKKGRPFQTSPDLERQGFLSYDDTIRASAARALQTGLIPDLIDGDFPAMGKAYRDLGEEEWGRARSIAFERHFAFNWLCGLAPGNRWDETPTDT